MEVKVKIERGDDGTYGAYIENNNLPYGIIGEGKTADMSIQDFLNSYEEMKRHYKTKEKEFVEAKFDFVYDVASFLNYYSKVLTLAGLEKITGVNQGQLSHYVNGRRKPGKKTVEKIELNLHRFADELKEVEFI